jgi:DNA-binding transcriptional MerR regulator
VADELVNIGTFALQTGLSIPMLRYYHEIGVLEPASVDPDTGYRRYSREQVARARLIGRLRSVEVPVTELTQVLAADGSGLRAILQTHRGRLSARIEDTQRMLALVNDLLKEEIPMETQGSFLVEVVLRVRDLDGTVDFYRRVLGFDFQPDDHNGAAPLHYDACGGSWQPQGTQLFTLWPAGDRPETTGMQIGFGVPNVDEVWARASEAGARLVSAPADDPYVPRNATFKDPGGNEVEIYERAGW